MTQAMLYPDGSLTIRCLSTDQDIGWREMLDPRETLALTRMLGVAPSTGPQAVALDEMATILSASGYLVRAPGNPFDEHPWRHTGEYKQGAIGDVRLGLHALSAPEVAALYAEGLDTRVAKPLGLVDRDTVFEHCCRVDEARFALPVDQAGLDRIRQRLDEIHIPPDGLYADWGVELSRAFPERWPWDGAI
jgi:hypothetical protein